MSDNIKFTDYFKDVNVELLRKKMYASIEDLKINREEYLDDTRYTTHFQTLIGGGAGQYAGKEFLELIGVSESEIDEIKCDIAKDTGEYGVDDDCVREAMEELTSDLNIFVKENQFDMQGCTLHVWYDENGSGICVYIEHDTEDRRWLEEDEDGEPYVVEFKMRDKGQEWKNCKPYDYNTRTSSYDGAKEIAYDRAKFLCELFEKEEVRWEFKGVGQGHYFNKYNIGR